MTGAAFLGSLESNALHLKLDAYQAVQIDAPSENVSAKRFRAFAKNAKLLAERLVGFLSKKGDLPFVILGVIEESVSANPAAGDAVYSHGLDRLVASGSAPVVSHVVVAF